ncbi:MAG: superoxide dismutase [Deltaproteobacteria bacterium]|nr:superoxide dismutase [Deltaproteobacteria bacterium]
MRRQRRDPPVPQLVGFYGPPINDPVFTTTPGTLDSNDNGELFDDEPSVALTAQSTGTSSDTGDELDLQLFLEPGVFNVDSSGTGDLSDVRTTGREQVVARGPFANPPLRKAIMSSPAPPPGSPPTRGDPAPRSPPRRVPLRLPALPYAADALEPVLSGEAVDTHYEKYQRRDLERLEHSLEGSLLGDQPLDGIVRLATGEVFDHAAQVWNHTFYWNSMTPRGGGRPRRGRIAKAIDTSFGSYDEFAERFQQTAAGLFGCGYVWLYRPDETDRVELAALPNAGNPLSHGGAPILVADLWEHAYYLDHREQSARYVRLFLERLVHWDFAEQNLSEVRGLAARVGPR